MTRVVAVPLPSTIHDIRSCLLEKVSTVAQEGILSSSLSDVRCPMFDVRCPMSDVRCPMSDVRCPMFDVRLIIFRELLLSINFIYSMVSLPYPYPARQIGSEP